MYSSTKYTEQAHLLERKAETRDLRLGMILTRLITTNDDADLPAYVVRMMIGSATYQRRLL